MSIISVKNSKKTVKLCEIATIKKIKLHEIRVEDLLVTDRLYSTWSCLAGSQNANATFLAGLLDESPRFLDNLNIEFLQNPHEDIPRQHLDIFHTKSQDVGLLSMDDKRCEEARLGENELIIANKLKGFLLREVAVVRLREEWRDSILLQYIQREIEDRLPDLLAKLKPEVTYDSGCNIPNRINPPTTDVLGECPVEIIPLHEQFTPEGAELTAEGSLEKQERPFYKHLDDILNSLAPDTIQAGTLAECLDNGFQIPGQSWPWRFPQDLQRCLKAMIDANDNLENLKKNPANQASSALQLIDAHEKLKRFLVERGPWGGDSSLFERIVVARLALALPEQGNLWTAIEDREKRREAEVKAEEKDRIMGILSHNIKGLLASAVIDPLELMRLRGIGDNVIVDEALRGAGLLREMVNAVNLSQGGTREDLLADLRDPDEKALSLADILRHGLRAAFTNMFDSKYFNRYYSVHFPKADLFYEARKVFVDLPLDDTAALLDFGRRYLHIATTWYCPETIVALEIGNRRNSALKLLILFQELFMNAVKNATFTKPDHRSLAVTVQREEGMIGFTVSNSFNPDETRADTRLGQGIVNGFLRQFGAERPTITQKDGLFTIRFSLACASAAGEK